MRYTDRMCERAALQSWVENIIFPRGVQYRLTGWSLDALGQSRLEVPFLYRDEEPIEHFPVWPSPNLTG